MQRLLYKRLGRSGLYLFEGMIPEFTCSDEANHRKNKQIQDFKRDSNRIPNELEWHVLLRSVNLLIGAYL